MSTQVDERVVSMRFDNQRFEKNIQSTLSSLDKLKHALRLDGASKGLEDVDSAAKKLDLNPLSKATETVGLKFSAMYTMADQALRNITTSAMNAGKRIASALTIDPIKTGLQEYETQINSVQTILANTESKGSTLQDVNSALDTLNAYADKTIYNFTEMTRNIGTFTAAGVDLETSVNAIQGIANLAAVSGSTSQQASTAMYQLSQALSSGTVKLMDWNSVVNAGMGGQVFQDALKATARVHGVAIDKMIEKSGSFRETLSEEWLTADILTETLNKFTLAAEEGSKEWDMYKKSLIDQGYSEEDALAILKLANTATDAATKVKTFTQLWDTTQEAVQSGWTSSWEIIIGDFGEAKEFLTGISETIGPLISESADARNKLLTGGLTTGWKQLLSEGIADEEGYKEVLKSVVEANGKSYDEMLKDTKSFDEALKKGLKDGTLNAETFTKSVTVMADKMRNMTDEERKAAGYTADHVVQIEKLEAGLKDGSISMDEFVEKMSKQSGRQNIIDALYNSFNAVMAIITPIREAFSEIFPPATGDQLYDLTVKIKEFSEKLIIGSETAEKLKSTFKGVFAVIKLGVTIISQIAQGLIKLIGAIIPVGGGLLSVTGSLGDFLTGLADAASKCNVIGAIFDGLVKIVTPLGKGIKWALDGLASGVNKLGGVTVIIDKVRNAISWLFNTVKEAASGAMGNGQTAADVLVTLFSGGAFGAILLGIKKFIGVITDITENGGSIIDSINSVLEGVTGCFEQFQNSIKANVLLKIAIAIGILAASLIAIAFIDPARLGSALAAITGLFVDLFASMAIFEKIMGSSGFNSIGVISTAMIKMSVAILILSVAMKSIADLSWNGIAKGLTGITVLLAELVAISLILSKNQASMVQGSTGLILFAGALVIMTQAIRSLATLSWEQLSLGLTGLGLILTELYIFMKAADFDKMGALKGAGILMLAGAINIMATAVTKLAALNWAEVGRGLAALGGIFLELSIFMALTKKAKNMITTAMGLTILGSAMLIFAKAVGMMGSLSWSEIGKGLTGMAGALAAITLALTFMPTNILTNAVGLVAIGAAMMLLGNALKNMSGLSWEEIGKGMTVLGGSLTAIATAMSFMAGSLPGAAAVLIVAASLVVLAGAMHMIGDLSWEEIGKGMVVMAGTFLILGVAAAVLASVSPVILMLGASVLMIGAGCIAAGAGVILLATGITALGVAFTVSGATVMAFLEIIVTQLPALVVSFINGLTTIIQAIGNSASSIFTAIGQLLTAILQMATSLIPQLVTFISTLLNGVLQIVINIIPKFYELVANLILNICTTIQTVLPTVLETVVMILVGVYGAFLSVLPKLLEVVAAVITGILNVIISLTPKIVEAVITVITGILDAIIAIQPKIVEVLATIINAILMALQQVIPVLAETIGVLLDAVLDILIEYIPKIVVGAYKLIQGLIDGMVEMVPKLANSAVNLMIAFIEAITTQIPRLVDTGFKMIIDFINGLADSIRTNTPLLITAVNNLIDAVIDAIIAYYGNFASKGKEIVTNIVDGLKEKFGSVKDTAKDMMDGFIKGVKEKFTDIKDAAVGAVEGAVDGVKSFLGIKSPSRVFAEIGKYADEGLAKGLTKYADVAGEAAHDLGDNVVSELQKSLDINSPSKVVQDEVGRYIVQGVAEGIKKDMSAEEQAEQKAKNIVNAFKKELDKYDLGSDISKKELQLWSLGEGKGATQAEKDAKELDYYNVELSRKLAKQTLAYDEWKETAKYLGEDSEEARNAWNKYLASQIEVANIQSNIDTVNKRMANSESTEAEKAMEVRAALQENWLKTTGKYASDAEVTARLLEDANADLGNLNTQLANANRLHEEAIATYGADSDEVYAAWQNVLAFENAIADKKDEIAGIRDEATSKEISSLDDAMDKRSIEYDLWKETNRDLNDDALKTTKEIEYLQNNLNDETAQLAIYEAEYAKICAEYGENSEEAKEALNRVLNQKLDIAKIRNEIVDVEEDSLQKERDKLEERYELASSNADIEYQIWEKTTGRKASVAEKNMVKLAILSKQLNSQSKILEISRKEWMEAADKYGKSSNEAQSKYNEYLNQQLELANLQNEITDINESTVERQKLAQSEYKKYIDKYEKYYLMNGMTKEDLERDARLVSGYDPNNTVNNIIAGTNKAFESLEDNSMYGTLKSNLNSLGGTWVDAINTGVTESVETVINTAVKMISSATDAIKTEENYFKWRDVGKYLVYGLAKGIKMNTSVVVKVAREVIQAAEKAAREAAGIHSPSKMFAEIGRYSVMGLAKGLIDNADLSNNAASELGQSAIDNLKATIQRISDVVESDLDTQPTIRPVLDLSNVEAGTARLSTMFSRTQAMSISAARAEHAAIKNQNGDNTPNNAGNTYQFTQNNYSPKALSRPEIYRQTKNQFAAMKEVLK